MCTLSLLASPSTCNTTHKNAIWLGSMRTRHVSRSNVLLAPQRPDLARIRAIYDATGTGGRAAAAPRRRPPEAQAYESPPELPVPSELPAGTQRAQRSCAVSALGSTGLHMRRAHSTHTSHSPPGSIAARRHVQGRHRYIHLFASSIGPFTLRVHALCTLDLLPSPTGNDRAGALVDRERVCKPATIMP